MQLVEVTKKIMELLLDYGADKNIPPSSIISQTTTKFLRNYISKNIQVMEDSEQDLERNVIPDLVSKISTTKDSKGNNPLHILSKHQNIDLDFYKLFLNLGVDSKNIDLDSPIHIASKYGNIDVVKFLITNHANIHAANRLKQTPLHCAVLAKSTAMVKFLARNHADINAQDLSGTTPLIAAIQKSDLPTVKLLLSLGANPFLQDSRGLNYIDLAIKNTNNEYIKALFHTDAPLLTMDFRHIQPEKISLLLENALNHFQNNIIENKLSHLLIDRNSDKKTKQKVVSILYSMLNKKNVKCKEFLESLKDNKFLAFKISKVVNSIPELSNEQKSEINELYGLNSLWEQLTGYFVAFFYLIQSLFTDYDHQDSLVSDIINQKIESVEAYFNLQQDEAITNYKEAASIVNAIPFVQALNGEINF
jgi:ankyrin repeat protein